MYSSTNKKRLEKNSKLMRWHKQKRFCVLNANVLCQHNDILLHLTHYRYMARYFLIQCKSICNLQTYLVIQKLNDVVKGGVQVIAHKT